MNVTVHYSTTTEKKAVLRTLAATAHAENVARYIERLNCSAKEKLALIDAVIAEVRNRR